MESLNHVSWIGYYNVHSFTKTTLWRPFIATTQHSTRSFALREGMCAERGKVGGGWCLPAEMILLISQWFLTQMDALKRGKNVWCLSSLFHLYIFFFACPCSDAMSFSDVVKWSLFRRGNSFYLEEEILVTPQTRDLVLKIFWIRRIVKLQRQRSEES